MADDREPSAALIRVSTDEQDRGCSPLDQLRAHRRYAKEHGLRIVRVYRDRGISGALGEDSRPGLAALTREAPHAEWRILQLWDEKRLARNFRLAGHILWPLEKLGIRVVYISTPNASEFESNVRHVMAHEQREQMKREIQRGVDGHRGRCRHYGPWILLGYQLAEDGTEAVDPAGAEIVRRIYQLRLEGLSTYAIGREVGLHQGRVAAILRHPGYTGAYTSHYRKGRPQNIVQGKRPAIIDPETWERVQTMRPGARAWGSAHASLPLTGLLCCDVCSARLRQTRTYQRRTDGEITRRYVCIEHRQIRIYPDGWPDAILEATLAHLSRPDLAAWIAARWDALHHGTADIAQIEGEVRALSARVARLEAAVASGQVPDPTGLYDLLGRAQRARSAAERRLFVARRDAGAMRTSPAMVQAAIARTLARPDLKADRPTLCRLLTAIIVREDRTARVRIRGGAVGLEPVASGSIGDQLCPLTFDWPGIVRAV